MSKIDYQKLREIAEKTKIAGEAPVMPFDQRINALNDFMKHFSPDIALALLDERERNQQYIKSRDQENEDIALTVGRLRVELEAAKKRIAELEAEPVSQTCKLNEPSGNSPVTPDGWISCSDRMPDDGQHVIILCDGAFVLYAQYRDGEFFDVVRNGEEFFETQSRNVTDWMPLPEPPQEVNRG
ncbi:TPA: ead/Ea22-like family protein [Escherichia coli]|nr:ead/Ea22-like family protein [Escherichia coli]